MERKGKLSKGIKRLIHRMGQRNRQRGVSLVETVIMLPVLMLIGLGIVQYALVYEAKSSLNYATLLSARAGALDHARPEALRVGFAKGLAPLYSLAEGEQGMLEAQRKVGQDILDEYVHFAIINPTTDAFGDFAQDLDLNGQVNDIPNLDLQSLSDNVGRSSGVNIQDANLLKVHITYGARLLVPFVGPMTASIAQTFTDDPIRLRMLRAGRLPITASATVRMQNFATRNALMLSRNQVESALVGGRIPSPNPIENPGGGSGEFEPLPGGEGGGSGGEGEQPPSEEEPPVVIEQPEENPPTPQTPPIPEVPLCTGDIDAEERAVTSEDVEDITEEERGFLSSVAEGVLSVFDAVGEAASRLGEAAFDALPGQVQDFLNETADTLQGVGEAASAAFDFFAGFANGLVQQGQDLVDLVTNPGEALAGIKELIKAFIDDPVGTIQTLGETILTQVQGDINTLINCSAFERGQVLGQYADPIRVIRIFNTLARFGNNISLRRAIDESDGDADVPVSVATRTFTNRNDFNRAANSPEPNTRYEFNGQVFITDDLGRITHVSGQVRLNPANNRAGTDGVSTTTIGNGPDAQPGDVGFHLIGDRFDGPTNRLNVVPGNGTRLDPDGPSNLNQGAFRSFEDDVAQAIRDNPGRAVEIRIEPIYRNGNTTTRPDAFSAAFRVEGGTFEETIFRNQPGG